MKKIILIAAVCFSSIYCLAQFNTTLIVNANPPGSLLDWGTKDLTYLVPGGAGLVGQAIIKATLKTTDGTIVATTNLGLARVRTVGSTNLVLYAPDVIPLEVMTFTGKFKASMDRSGKLPAGSYELCVQLVTPVDFHPLSEERCRDFTVAAFQLPIPMMPANETILDIEKAKSVITFRWTPVTPAPGQPVTYRVTVFEILPNQTPMQALRSNQPLLAKDIIGTSQYIWQPQLGLTICCKDGDVTGDEKNINTSEAGVGTGKDQKTNTPKPDMDPDTDAYAFIWTIQTFDRQGRPFGDGNINGDGISEPNVFFIDRRPLNMRKAGPPSRILFLNNLKGKRN